MVNVRANALPVGRRGKKVWSTSLWALLLALCAHVAPRSAHAAHLPLVTQLAAGGQRPQLVRALSPRPAGGQGRQDDDFDLSAHQTLSRVNLLIRENYVEPDRVKPYDMFVAALDYIQRTVPEVMVDDTEAPSRIKMSVGNKVATFELGSIDQLWEVTMALRDVFRFLQAHIADKQEQRNIEWAAINGMLSTLDPHSVLLKPESFDEMKMSTRGEFGGLGIVISLRDGALTIISPIEGTPASNVGLKARDKIVKIGVESTVNMGLDEAVQRLRGEPDSKVDISVQRVGWTEPRPFTITRAIIKIESVSSKLLDGGIGYLKIKSFQGNTFEDMTAAMDSLRGQNKQSDLKGLVLDLRNNPGGLLDQAILVSDRFIEQGALVITVGEGNRRREVRQAHKGPDEMTYPIVVLLNGGSASASEIVAGGLKNHDRAVILGQQSFGKGSVQVLYDLEKSGLKLTIAQYLTPGDLSIQSVGVVPDILVTPATIEPDGIRLFVDDESLREKDLAKHLEQHGASKLVVSSERLYHLVREAKDPNKDPNGASDRGDAQQAEIDASLAQVTGRFEYDFEVALAHDLLRQVRSLSRPAMLQEGAALLAARGSEQQALIAARMGELGIDWRDGEQAAGATGKVVLTTNAKDGWMAAGELLRLTATLENTGEVPMYRMWGATQSDNPLLKNLEFAFGFVAPHSKKTWSVDIKLPKDLVARADEVVLPLGREQAQHNSVAGRTFVTITEQQKPEFSFRTALVEEEGNGDGCLQAGEHVKLLVDVTNVGPGIAEETTVIAKNLSGQSLFLANGRASIGRIGVGETKRAELKFLVFGQASAKQAEQNARIDGDERSFAAAHTSDVLSLRLMIWDGALGASVTEKLSYQVAAPAAAQQGAGTLKSKKARTTLYAGACAGAQAIGDVGKSATLDCDLRVGGYGRTTLADGTKAFVALSEATFAADPRAGKRGNKEAARRAKSAEVQRLAGTRAPRIAIEPASLIIDQEVFHLRGHVDDPRALKDLFVFVGDKKVYFRSLRDTAPEHGCYRHRFDIPIKLKPGTNAVALFVRENEELANRRLFFVHRTESKVVPTPVAPAVQSR